MRDNEHEIEKCEESILIKNQKIEEIKKDVTILTKKRDDLIEVTNKISKAFYTYESLLSSNNENCNESNDCCQSPIYLDLNSKFDNRNSLQSTPISTNNNQISNDTITFSDNSESEETSLDNIILDDDIIDVRKTSDKVNYELTKGKKKNAKKQKLNELKKDPAYINKVTTFIQTLHHKGNANETFTLSYKLIEQLFYFLYDDLEFIQVDDYKIYSGISNTPSVDFTHTQQKKSVQGVNLYNVLSYIESIKKEEPLEKWLTTRFNKKFTGHVHIIWTPEEAIIECIQNKSHLEQGKLPRSKWRGITHGVTIQNNPKDKTSKRQFEENSDEYISVNEEQNHLNVSKKSKSYFKDVNQTTDKK